MKAVLIDLNIILDFFEKRNFHKEAATIFELCHKKKIKGYVCAHEITTLSYFLEKKFKKSKIISYAIKELLDIVKVLSLNELIIRKALDSKINDFEDAVIDEIAIENNINVIITRNIKDFKKGKCTSISSSEFVLDYV